MDYSNPKSLHNWIEKLDLTCAPRWKVGFISSAYFIGWGLTLLWLPLLADKYGRRRIFISGTIIDLCFYSGIMITQRLNVMIWLSFFEGLAASCTQTVGYVYVMELLPARRQSTFTSIYSSWDTCLTYLIATLYFRFVSDHWFYLAMFGYILQIICVGFVWFMPESPKLLVELNRLDEAEAAMIRIAWFGGTTFDPFDLNEINNGFRTTMHANKMNQSEVSHGSTLRHRSKRSMATGRSGVFKSKVHTSGIYEEE